MLTSIMASKVGAGLPATVQRGDGKHIRVATCKRCGMERRRSGGTAPAPICMDCQLTAKDLGEYEKWMSRPAPGLTGAAGRSKPRPERRKDNPCGTRRGYHQHYRRGEKPCRACQDAKNAAERERRAQKNGEA